MVAGHGRSALPHPLKINQCMALAVVIPSSAPVDLTDGRGAVVAFRDISDRLRLRELETSRARIVQAADEARRRIERDLHDGAQQQFVAVAMRRETPGACSRSRPMTPRGSSRPRTPTSAKPSQNSSA
jgi:signal transduction histidine kinase